MNKAYFCNTGETLYAGGPSAATLSLSTLNCTALLISLQKTFPIRSDSSHHHRALLPLPFTHPSPNSGPPSLLAALCFRHRLVSLELDEQRSGAAHRLDNGETLRDTLLARQQPAHHVGTHTPA